VAQRDLEAAEELMRKGRFADAIERFRAFLSDEPENPELRARCGEAYRLSGNAERAFHHYNKGAAIYARMGDALNSLRLLIFANSLSPGEPDILYRMAECKKALHDSRDLEGILRQLISAARGTGDRRRLWALEELCLLHPEDMDLQLRRAEALTEAGRIDDAVTAWKTLSARLDQRGVDLVPMLQRAGQIAPDRADVGVDLASILLANRRAREALILLVPYYEKFPDDIAILETLLRALEALGAQDKITPARIELIKARAKRSQRDPAIKEIGILLQTAGDDIAALEVSAHAYTAFGEMNEAVSVWRRLAYAYDRSGKKYERDRAILMLLKANPDDEDALTLGARALREAGRAGEAEVLENRLGLLRRIRARNVIPQRPRSSSEAAALEGDGGRAAIAKSFERKAQSAEPRSGNLEELPIRRMPVESPKTAPPRPKVPTSASLKRPPQLPNDDSDARALTDAFESEEPTMPPDEVRPEDIEAIGPSELSEPSIEAIPITMNPWTEGLVLDSGKLRVPTIPSRPRSEPPRLNDRGARDNRDRALTPTRPLTPAEDDPDDDPWGPDPDERATRPPSMRSAPRPFEQEPTSQEAVADTHLGSLDAVADDKLPPDTARGMDALVDSDSGVDLPLEMASGAEETTSRMAQLVDDELRELRGQPGSTSRGANARSKPSESLPPAEFADADALQPTARQRLVADLYDEARKVKKL
jgi:tetratricopeptide (TPR) repeat protein